jgi:hypothetical protein
MISVKEDKLEWPPAFTFLSYYAYSALKIEAIYSSETDHTAVYPRRFFIYSMA